MFVRKLLQNKQNAWFIYIYLLILVLGLILSQVVIAEKSQLSFGQGVKCILVAYFMDYFSNFPKPKLNVTIELNDNIVLNGVTDDFGCVKYSFKTSESLIYKISMNKISIHDNLTIIKVQDYMVKELNCECSYTDCTVTYTGLNIRPVVFVGHGETLLYYYVYVLKAKIINVSDLDLSALDTVSVDELRFTGRKLALDLKPAIPVGKSPSIYESLYLFPLNYPVEIKIPVYRFGHIVDELSITATVNENTSCVHVMGPLLEVKLREMLDPLEDRVASLKKLGLSMIDEERLLVRINTQKEDILRLIAGREYDSAFNRLKFLVDKIKSLKGDLSSLDLSLMFSLLVVMAFIYTFSSLVSALVAENYKKKLVLRCILYTSSFILLLLGHTEFRAALSILLERILLIDIKRLDVFTMFLIGSIIGSLGIIVPMIISLYFPPVASWSLDLSVKDIKRHLSRSILTVLTLSLVVGSAMAVFKITYSHMVSERTSLTDFKHDVICLQPTSNRIMVKDDLVFLKSIDWVGSVYFIKSLHDEVLVETESGWVLHGTSLIEASSQDYTVLVSRAVVVDPSILDRYFNFSSLVVKGSFLAKGERCILVPASLPFRLTDRVKLTFMVKQKDADVFVDAGEFDLGEFVVKGFFDPDSAGKIRLPDGSPLFEDPYKTVIIPEDYIPDTVHVQSLKIHLPRKTVVYRKPQRITMLKIRYALIVPDPCSHVDVYEKAKGLLELTGYRVFAVFNGLCRAYEELYVLNVVGISSIAPPVAIASLIIALTMNSIIYERRREIWTLAVVGGNPRTITNMFLMNAFIVGLLSTAIGYLGYTAIYLLSGLLAP
ncbi:hypothetical protein DRO58_06915, partial [Candidatus Bathyarchaeota archaeon]